MGSAVVEEYAALGVDVNGRTVQMPGELIAVQKVTTSATTAKTAAAFNAKTRFLVVSSDTDVNFVLGDSSVTATSAGRTLYASTYRPLPVNPGPVHPPFADSAEVPTHIAFIDK